jgi:hypothetical protein
VGLARGEGEDRALAEGEGEEVGEGVARAAEADAAAGEGEGEALSVPPRPTHSYSTLRTADCTPGAGTPLLLAFTALCSRQQAPLAKAPVQALQAAVA